jgi:hypothetical protein
VIGQGFTLVIIERGHTMAIGTTRTLPLGITVYDCRAAVRRRRLIAACTLCAVAAVGFAMAGKVRDLIATRSAEAQAAGVSRDTPQGPVKAFIEQPVAEAPIPAPPATEPTALPVLESQALSAGVMEPPTPPTPAQLSSPPIVIRGAGMKTR